jgi:hypothetical protein
MTDTGKIGAVMKKFLYKIELRTANAGKSAYVLQRMR